MNNILDTDLHCDDEDSFSRQVQEDSERLFMDVSGEVFEDRFGTLSFKLEE